MDDYADGFHLLGSLDMNVVASELQNCRACLRGWSDFGETYLCTSTFNA